MSAIPHPSDRRETSPDPPLDSSRLLGYMGFRRKRERPPTKSIAQVITGTIFFFFMSCLLLSIIGFGGKI
jgi:membrane-associated protease RseP (regulator of RpoE activity)